MQINTKLDILHSLKATGHTVTERVLDDIKIEILKSEVNGALKNLWPLDFVRGLDLVAGYKTTIDRKLATSYISREAHGCLLWFLAFCYTSRYRHGNVGTFGME